MKKDHFKSHDWFSPYLMHAISKLANIITHGYVCELKRREEWLTVNGKHKKSKFTYSVVPLFRVLQAPSDIVVIIQHFPLMYGFIGV